LERSELETSIERLERELRIIRKKLERSEANRRLLEESYTAQVDLLKILNAELCESQELIRQSESRYKNLASFDALTGLPSRTLFQDRLQQVVCESKRAQQFAAVMFIDIDKFKGVNDLAGHEAGDEVLRGAGNRLTGCIRSGDMVARIGGDEFIVLLESFSERQVVVHIAERILTVMSEPFSLQKHQITVGASIGISLFPNDGSDAETLLKKADGAMYEVKRNGGNAWHFYDPLSFD